MTHRVYIAAPIFNEQQLAVVEWLERQVVAAGMNYFSPYRHSQLIWNGRKPSECSQEERDLVLKGNVQNLQDVDLLLAWVGGTQSTDAGGKKASTDTGVVWEMGYANALSVTTIAYVHPLDDRQDMNIMLAGTVDAAVRCAPEFPETSLTHPPGAVQHALRLWARGGTEELSGYYPPNLPTEKVV